MVLPKKQRLGAKSAEKFYYNKIIEDSIVIGQSEIKIMKYSIVRL
jgi:hypothetical protein